MHSFSKRTAFSAWMLMALTSASAYGGITNTLLRGGAGDGKIAKYQFTLHDNMIVTSVAWSPDGKFIAATSTQAPALHLWDIKTRKLVAKVGRDRVGRMGELSWSPDGRYLSVCGGYGKLRIYSGANLSEVRIIQQTRGRSCDKTAFSTDGSRFASLGITSYTLDVYSTSDWQLLRHFDNSTGWTKGHAFKSIAYLPGTDILAVGGGEFEHRGSSDPMNGFIYFLGPDDAEPSRRIQAYRYEQSVGMPGPVRALAFSPDGKRVATGTDTGSGFASGEYIKFGVCVLDVGDGSILGRPLDGVGSAIGAPGGLAYTSDGRYIVTGHTDDQHSPIHIIDGKTIHVVDAVPTGGTVYDIATNPKGGEFAAGIDQSIVVWSLTAQP